MRDSDVRGAVRRMLCGHYGNDVNTRIVEEMGIWSGSVRIDLAVINGALSGFELKSDRDNLDRLPLQAELYSRVFDHVTLVVGRRHIAEARTKIPVWWGIVLAKQEGGAVTLHTRRSAKANPNLDPYLVAQLLWKDEAVCVLEKFHLDKGWRSKPAKVIHQRLASELPLPTLSHEVRCTLRRRVNWLGQLSADKRQMSVEAD